MRDSEFVRRLREGLKQAGVSQVGLARHLGVGASYVAGVATGRRQPFSDARCRAAEAHLGLPDGHLVSAAAMSRRRIDMTALDPEMRAQIVRLAKTSLRVA